MGRSKKRSPPKKRTGFALVADNPSTARAAHKAAVAAADKARRAQRVTEARARYGGPDAQGPPVAGSVAVLGERERLSPSRRGSPFRPFRLEASVAAGPPFRLLWRALSVRCK